MGGLGGVRGEARGWKRRKRKSLWRVGGDGVSTCTRARIETGTQLGGYGLGKGKGRGGRYGREEAPREGRARVHEREACPCHPDLRDAQQARETLEAADRLAAREIGPAGGEDEDGGEGAGRGCAAEQDEVGRYPFGRAPVDDAVVLWEVGDEDSEEDESGVDGLAEEIWGGKTAVLLTWRG